MPSEPADSLFKTKVTIAAYPTHEAGDIIWVYMGPTEKQPPPPDYEFMRAPKTHRFVGKHVQDNNYLQSLEGALDSAHATILHNLSPGDLSWLSNYDLTVPRLDVEKTDYGYMYSGVRYRDGQQWVRAYQYVMPATQFRGRVDGLLGGSVAYIGKKQVPTINGHIWTPIDDHTTASYNFMYSYSPDQALPRDEVMDQETKDGRGPDNMRPDYRLIRNLSNDYLIDRSKEKTMFVGIDGVNTQDIAMQEGMGPIVDRSLEHLGTSDRAVIVMRQLVLEAIDVVASGGDPRGVDPTTYRHVRALDHMIPEGLVWPEALRDEIVAKF
jgi:phenylpropionate dioxygenase-like ring-hydroxylating dioxygenase large terminal subunit